jgi:hypothetical protein
MLQQKVAQNGTTSLVYFIFSKNGIKLPKVAQSSHPDIYIHWQSMFGEHQ